MTVLITGGAGFIGSHLADAYLDRGDTVMIIDDLSTGDLRNIAHLRQHPNFIFESARVEDTPTLRPWADRADLILHMAAAVGVKLVVENSVRAIDTNLESTMAVLRAAAPTQTPVFLASSSEVYGKSDRFPFSEDNPLAIGAPSVGRWSYACSKAMGEFLGLAHYKEHGTPIVIARLFNTSGPRQTGRYGMVLPTFVRQALANQSITVYGDGLQSRCFTHVKDVVQAIVELMRSPDAVGQVFNVGNHAETTIIDLAHRVRTLTGSSSDIKHLAHKEAYGTDFEETYRRVPDLTKIGRCIGYQPRRTLDAIIRDVIQFERNTHSMVA